MLIWDCTYTYKDKSDYKNERYPSEDETQKVTYFILIIQK